MKCRHPLSATTWVKPSNSINNNKNYGTPKCSLILTYGNNPIQTPCTLISKHLELYNIYPRTSTILLVGENTLWWPKNVVTNISFQNFATFNFQQGVITLTGAKTIVMTFFILHIKIL
jgi:hypothetical protein